MRVKHIIWLLVFGLIGVGLLFYFKPSKPLDTSVAIDRVVVTKHQRKLDLMANGKVVKSYSISLGRVPEGAKEYEGDKKTPEGLYIIHDRNPYSGYHKNLGVSYPNTKDIAHARSLGKSPGGLIKIHGIKNRYGWIGRFHLLFDWTYGCIAVTDEAMDELYEHVKIGTPIEILP